MSTDSTINMRLLREVMQRCLDECERQLGSNIELAADHYWMIEPLDAFDLTKVPSPVAGQISDDLESVQRALHQPPSDPYLIWHEVGHLLGPLARLASLSAERLGEPR